MLYMAGEPQASAGVLDRRGAGVSRRPFRRSTSLPVAERPATIGRHLLGERLLPSLPRPPTPAQFRAIEAARAAAAAAEAQRALDGDDSEPRTSARSSTTSSTSRCPRPPDRASPTRTKPARADQGGLFRARNKSARTRLSCLESLILAACAQKSITCARDGIPCARLSPRALGGDGLPEDSVPQAVVTGADLGGGGDGGRDAPGPDDRSLPTDDGGLGVGGVQVQPLRDQNRPEAQGPRGQDVVEALGNLVGGGVVRTASGRPPRLGVRPGDRDPESMSQPPRAGRGYRDLGACGWPDLPALFVRPDDSVSRGWRSYAQCGAPLPPHRVTHERQTVTEDQTDFWPPRMTSGSALGPAGHCTAS